MRAFYFVFVWLAFWSCSSGNGKNSGDGTITISGKIQNVGVGEVILEYFNGPMLVTVDTLTVNEDGTYYSRYQPEEPGYYRINYYQTQFVNILFTGKPIVVNVDGSNPTAFFEVLGSEEMDYLKELNSIMEKLRLEANGIQKSFEEAAKANDTVKMTALREQFFQRQKETNHEIKDKIRNMGTSLALLQALNYIDRDQEFPFIDSIANVIDAAIPDYRIKVEFINEIEKLRKLAIGSPAPEIALPDPDGNIVTLSSLRGSYVLVDFWASWCGPCRKENPNIVKMYNRYRDKGFKIFGVSLDRKGEDWIKAIEMDGLTWTQVSDLKYFQSDAAKEYNINAIPASFLLDKQGNIIGKDLRGKLLEDKLEEIF